MVDLVCIKTSNPSFCSSFQLKRDGLRSVKMVDMLCTKATSSFSGSLRLKRAGPRTCIVMGMGRSGNGDELLMTKETEAAFREHDPTVIKFVSDLVSSIIIKNALISAENAAVSAQNAAISAQNVTITAQQAAMTITAQYGRGMAAARASNFKSPLQRDLLSSLQRKNLVIDNASLHGVVKNTGFPVSRAVTVNRKWRFMVMCMSCNSYEVHQSPDSDVSSFTGGGDRSGVSGDDELGPILNFEEVMKEIEAKGVSIPLDMLEAAKRTGIPKLFLLRYLAMQGFGWGLAFATRSCSMFRNQMMIDPSYLIKLGKEFAFDVFVDVLLANVMSMIGRDSKEIVIFLWLRLFDIVVTEGFIAPFKYGRRIKRQQTSISQELYAANGYIPPYYSVFEAERSESLSWAAYWCAAAYCCAAAIFTLLMVLFYR